MKPNRVWAIEGLENGKWVPWNSYSATGADARAHLYAMRERHTHYKFRATPYEPVKKATQRRLK